MEVRAFESVHLLLYGAAELMEKSSLINLVSVKMMFIAGLLARRKEQTDVLQL